MISEIEEALKEEPNLGPNTINILIEEISSLIKMKYDKDVLDVFGNELDNDENFFRIIKNFLIENKISVIYQPTFRRIEKQVPGITFNPIENIYRSTFRPTEKRGSIRIEYLDHFENEYFNSRYSKYNNLIQFGLDDVKRNIDSICEEIRNITLAGYNKLSENILELFLISDENSTEPLDKKVLIKTLKLFLNRLGKPKDEISKYERLFERKYSSEPNSEIVLFLKQLVPVFKQSNHLEKKINSFESVINSYLKDTQEEKEFIFDTNRVTAKVINKITSQELNLNSLSSGEKQIFNIFSKLYLENNNDKNYIILFDEPELSLSLDWQKKFLPDIFHSPYCAQLFAITHSPFIFDNELKEYAGSLEIRNSINENI